MQRVSNIKLALGESEELLKQKALKKLRIKEAEVKYFKIVKKSLDARDKRDIKWVYTVDVSDKDERTPVEYLIRKPKKFLQQ